MKVCKFGGSSVADAARIDELRRIVDADPDRRVVVVSAPGKRHADDVKVTDLLIAAADAVLARGEADAEIDAVVERFASIQRDLNLSPTVLEEIERDLRARARAPREHPGQFIDAMKAAGEDNCAKLVAQALLEGGVDAQYVNPGEAGMLLSDEYGAARVLPEAYDKLHELRDHAGVSVFPGFFGYTKDGSIATFSRGGSDITGAILAAAVEADIYENFTDVDSVFSADPRIVENPRPIRELTYREMRELSYAGFAVFHDEAIMPAVRKRIPVCVRNARNLSSLGTMIVHQRAHTPGEVVGVASLSGFATIYVEKYLMNRMIGFGRRLLAILEEERIPFEHAPSGIDNMSVVVGEDEFTVENEQRILDKIHRELEPDDLRVERGHALIMIVGEGMDHAVGVAGRAAMALAKAGVNIEMINQGSSEISMMFGVRTEDREAGVRALHEEFLP